MDKTVYVYYGENCPLCHELMKFLDKNKIEYTKVSTESVEDYLEALTHQITVVPALRIEENKMFTSNRSYEDVLEWINENK